MQKIITILLFLTLLSACDNISDNSRLIYGKTGLPRNCRAIIKSNIDSYKRGDFSAEAALSSIDRNCGEFGYSWE